MPTLAHACAHEIVSLHAFFEHWFQGAFTDRPRALERLTGVLAPDFVLISPRGRATARAALVQMLSKAYGSWADDQPPGSIRVDSIEPRHVEGDLAVLTYIERHQRPSGRSARWSTVLMQRRPNTPNGVGWLHLHETWIPDDRP